MSGAAALPLGRARPAPAAAWPRHAGALGATLLALLLLFRRDVAQVAAIWWNASTYEHCLAILPVLGWLVWLRRDLLAAVRPRAWAPPLGWVAAGALCWLVGEAAGIAVARHLALAVMIQGAVAALLGAGAARVLLFPLFYLIFLVPAGDALVPLLQTVTARMCVALLALARVPAMLDGVFITTPAGWFKVAEACSGAKFLIAMIALGVLVAHLGFATWRRRVPFLLACVAVPILANGLRAFATIWIAQYTGAKAAGSFDHVVYGWVFFALVIALVLAVSWRFFDRAPGDHGVDSGAIARAEAVQRRSLRLPVAAAAVLAIAAAAPAWSALLALRSAAPVPAGAHLPDLPGWTQVAPGGVPWRPRFDGADRLISARYRDAAGAEVDVAAAVFAHPGEGRELVGYGRGAVDPDGPWAWTADRPAGAGWKAERIEGPGGLGREVMTSYRVGDTVTGRPAEVKLAELRQRLFGGTPGSAALLVSADDAHGGRAAVDRMVATLGAPAAALDRIVR